MMRTEKKNFGQFLPTRRPRCMDGGYIECKDGSSLRVLIAKLKLVASKVQTGSWIALIIAER